VAFSAGMAKNGFRPVVAIYSTFLQRSLDQIIHDVCLQNLPVVFAIDRAGLVGEDGPTHHGAFDLSFLRFIPGIVLMAPSDGGELEMMLRYAMKIKKPLAIRYPRGCVPKNRFSGRLHSRIALGKAEILQKGKKKVIVFFGNQIEKALNVAGKSSDCMIINARFAKPIDPRIISAINEAKEAVIIEENAKMGGFGSAILEELVKVGSKTRVRLMGIEDGFVGHGKVDDLRKKYLK
jgi:1-deoxy-D-xylulose-5-phosphate synthase